MPAHTRPVLLLTRPTEASDAVARRFADMPVEIVISPLIEIELREGIEVPEGTRGLVLTSVNGARAAGALKGPPMTAWCVGRATARAAEQAGYRAVSADGDATALVGLIQSQHAAGPLAHIRGDHSRGDVAGRLRANGIVCHEVLAYVQHLRPLTQGARTVLGESQSVIVPLYSPRTASAFAESGEFSAPIHIVALSDAVAEEARAANPSSMTVAARPTGAAMIEEIVRAIADHSVGPLEGPDGTH